MKKQNTLLWIGAAVLGVAVMIAGDPDKRAWEREGYPDGLEVSPDCREIRIYDLAAFQDWVGRNQALVSEWETAAATDPERALSLFTDELGCPKDEGIIYHRRDGFTHTGNEYIIGATQAEDSTAFLAMLFAI